MTRLETVLIRLDSDLRKLGCRWALVGGMAVSVRARPRTTVDVDVAVAVRGDEEAEQLIGRFRALGYEVRSTVEQTATGRLATVRLAPPLEGGAPASDSDRHTTVVDLLLASSGIEPEIAAAAERLTILPGLSVPVATIGHLLALKVLAEQENRPQDRADAIALIATARPRDLREAEHALELIGRRGYDRGKNLRSALERVLSTRPEAE